MTQPIEIINQAWTTRADLTPSTVTAETREAIVFALAQLDSGDARVAEPTDSSENHGWQVNEWLKKAVLLSFRIESNKMISAGDAVYYDKVPQKFSRSSCRSSSWLLHCS